MATYLQIHNTLAGGGEVAARLTGAFITAAKQVYAEDAGTPGHAQRKALAVLVAGDPANYASRFRWLVGVDPSVTAQATDADVLAAVLAVWNLMAGV